MWYIIGGVSLFILGISLVVTITSEWMKTCDQSILNGLIVPYSMMFFGWILMEDILASSVDFVFYVHSQWWYLSATLGMPLVIILICAIAVICVKSREHSKK